MDARLRIEHELRVVSPCLSLSKVIDIPIVTVLGIEEVVYLKLDAPSLNEVYRKFIALAKACRVIAR